MSAISIAEAGLALVARVIPSALLGIRKSLWAASPVQRTTKQLGSQFPLVRKQLSATIQHWISDDDVIEAVRSTKRGGEPATVTETTVDAFLRHSTIPDLPRDAAARFIGRFWDLLAQEAANEDSGPWRQENIVRYEGRLTRAEFRRQALHTNALIEKAGLSLPSVVAQQSDDQRYDQRIDEANTLFNDVKIRTALAVYEQILSDTSTQRLPPRVRYRLHANIGSCHLALGHLCRALTHFERARDVAPDEALPHWQIGQIRLHQGDSVAALEHAEEAIRLDSTDDNAWLIALRAHDSIDTLDIPSHILDTPEYALICAHKAFCSSDFDQAAELTRTALQRSPRSPDQLVDIAEILLVCSSSPPLGSVPESVRRDVVRLASEAIELLPDGERPYLEARALSVKGHALIDSDLIAAREAFARAISLAPEAIGPKVGLADVLLRTEEYAEARFMLRDLPERGADVRIHAVRARVMAAQNSHDPEIQSEIRRAMEIVDDDPRGSGFLLDLADIATRAELPDLAETLLDSVDSDTVPAVVHLLQARLATLRGNTQAAHDLYERAVSSTLAEHGTMIHTEFAGFLASQELHELAVGQLRAAGVENGPDHLQQFYVMELVQIGAWAELESFLEHVDADEGLPDWALDAASMLALRRDDLTKARTFLVELLSRGPEYKPVLIRLAYALIRMGERSEATRALDDWCSQSFAAPQSADAARLYYQARAHDAAIRTAYRGWRADPANAELEQLLILLVFGSPSDLPSITDPDQVAPDTWVRLEEVSGTAEVSYVLTSDAPIPGRVGEIASDSPEAALLIGKTVNDTVVLPPTGIDPVTYRVREIRTAIVGFVQNALRRVGTRVHPHYEAIQAVRIGSPDSVAFLARVISTVYSDQTSKESAREFYHGRRVPLAIFARLAGVSVRRAYMHLTLVDDEYLHVEFGSAASVNAALESATAANEVVVTTTAWFTLQSLGLLELLPQVYEQIRVPPSLVQSLMDERAQIAMEIEKGDAYRMAPGPMGLHLEEIPINVLQSEMERIDDLIDFIEMRSIPFSRPLEALLDEHQELRAALGDADMDALFAATTDRPMFADDQGLRALGYDQYGIPSFSTVSFLHAAEKRGVYSRDERLEATVALIEAGFTFIPISAELLLAALRLDNMMVGLRLRTVLRRLTTRETSIETTVIVAVAFLRAVLTHPLGQGAFEGVVLLLLDLFYEIPDEGAAIEQFDAVAEESLRLLPLAQDRYRQQRDAFRLIKEMTQ